MKTILALLALALTAQSAPRLPDRPDRFDRMTPRELFRWAFTAPEAEKPWRVIGRVEGGRKDPVAWGWEVQGAMQAELLRAYPDFDGTTPWQQWLEHWLRADETVCQPPKLVPGAMADFVWKARKSDGNTWFMFFNRLTHDDW